MTNKENEILIAFCKEHEVAFTENALLHNYTTFRIGGPCALMIEPNGEEQAAAIVKQMFALDMPFFTMGKGSNLLFKDEGYGGVIIRMENLACKMRLEDELFIIAESGTRLIDVANFALENSLSGLEFAYGIPGAVGGGLCMNAGAYDGDMKSIVHSCRYIDEKGEVQELVGDEVDLSYRHSFFSDNEGIITSVKFKLKKDNYRDVRAMTEKNWTARYMKQPLEYPSAGSVFKRPVGGYASALIDQSGLKGRSFGMAEVSLKHAGFIINKGGASCEDVLELVKIVQQEVKEKTGFILEKELKVIE